jgi:hypothetical protein
MPAIQIRLGIARGTLNNWIVLRREAQPEPKGISAIKRGPSDLELENARLERELGSAKLDLEILDKVSLGMLKRSAISCLTALSVWQPVVAVTALRSAFLICKASSMGSK